LSGRPQCRCRGQTRPTMPHGDLDPISVDTWAQFQALVRS
jgi:hypothetical protein